MLAVNNSAISAIGIGCEFLFARELEVLAITEDVFIAISTSGNIENILEAVKISKSRGIATFS